MPTTPYAKLLATVNGGAPQSGAVIAANGDTIQLSAESTAQWPLSPTPPRWEIYMYPEDWTGPASGWSTQSVAMPGGGTFDVYVYNGLGPPPSFTLPTLPVWGDLLMRLTVNNGQVNGVARPQLVDESTVLRILSPNGLRDVAPMTASQFNAARGWPGDLAFDLRIVDDVLAGSSTPYNSTPEIVTAGTGSAGLITQFARGDHRHQVSTGAAGTIAVGDAAATGSSTALARADHVHALPAPSDPASVRVDTSSAGTSAKVAREDHAHGAATHPPVSVGTTIDEGTADYLARADHVHDLPFAPVQAALNVASGDIGINNQALKNVTALEFSASGALGMSLPMPPSGGGSSFNLITGQPGNGAGNAGGDIVITTGLGGDPSTDPAGNHYVDLGRFNPGGGNRSSRLVLVSGDAGSFFTARLDETPEVVFEVYAPLRIDIPGFGKAIGITDAVSFGPNVSTPKYTQDDVATASATAPTLTLKAANATGATSIGGDTLIGGATGTSRHGNVCLHGAAPAGLGGKVLYAANASTEPTTNPTGGFVIWGNDRGVQLRGADGILSTLGPVLRGGSAGADMRADWDTVVQLTTTDATVTTAITFPMPDNCVCKFVAEGVAISASGGNCAGYRVPRTVKRTGGGSATAVGTAPATEVEEDVGDWDFTITGSGNDALVQVKGSAATTVNWLVRLRLLLLYKP